MKRERSEEGGGGGGAGGGGNVSHIYADEEITILEFIHVPLVI